MRPKENPWFRLPDSEPFVLSEDAEALAANRKLPPNYILHTDLIPEPFVGKPDAPVLLLGNNPGVKNPESAAHRRRPAFRKRMRDNLVHSLSKEFPLLYLDPSPVIAPVSRAWWERKLKSLSE